MTDLLSGIKLPVVEIHSQHTLLTLEASLHSSSTSMNTDTTTATMESTRTLYKLPSEIRVMIFNLVVNEYVLANTSSGTNGANDSNRLTLKEACCTKVSKNALGIWTGKMLHTHTSHEDNDAIMPLEKALVVERALYREILPIRVKAAQVYLLAPAEDEYRHFELFNPQMISPLLRDSIRSLQIYNE